jgi:hypothetical protein
MFSLIRETGPLPQESVTYVLVQTLLEMGYKITDEYETVNSALWEYAEALFHGLGSRDGLYIPHALAHFTNFMD